MLIGVPKEIKVLEARVALTPEGVSEFIRSGHKVVIEKGAGLGSAITDEQFIAAGASIESDVEKIWRDADMILKVKEPIEVEYSRLRAGQILFTYLHLAASKACTDALLKSGTTAIAYETVEFNGSLPLLAPMSEVAGRLAVQVGATALQKPNGDAEFFSAEFQELHRAKWLLLVGESQDSTQQLSLWEWGLTLPFWIDHFRALPILTLFIKAALKLWLRLSVLSIAKFVWQI